MQAEVHIAAGEDLIARQQVLLSRLRARADDTALAEDVLRHMRISQMLHVADRDRLRKLLEQDA
ncbi:MAG: hypothetical protein JO005_02290 [Gammaproteobacteria bacterium]|nr:hypothetical protein [Gammaproteobacteria bacterium]